jgi:plasmid stabilization system protein ParE
MLTRQLSAQETLEDIANWIQKSPQAQLRNPSQAQQIVCNVQ